MKCSFCGHDVPVGDNSCPFGGKKMPTVQNNPTCEEEKKTGSVEHPVASTPDVLKVPEETSIGFAIFSMVRGIASILRPAFFPDLFPVCLFLPLGDGKHRTLRLLSSDGRGERRKVLLGRDHHGLVRNRLVRGCGPLLSDFLAPESWIHPLWRKRR